MFKVTVRQLPGVFVGVVIGLCLGAGVQSRSQRKDDKAQVVVQGQPLVSIRVPNGAHMSRTVLEISGDGGFVYTHGTQGGEDIESKSVNLRFSNGVTLTGNRAHFSVRPDQPNGDQIIEVRPGTGQVYRKPPVYVMPNLQQAGR